MGNSVQFKALYNKAHLAGLAAGKQHQPAPMVVQQHKHVLDDNSPVVRSYFVPEGVCGFAWINVKPGNSAFARWLKVNNLARTDSYYGGVSIWVREFGQSYERKMAYAGAFAHVLVDEGIRASSNGRLD